MSQGNPSADAPTSQAAPAPAAAQSQPDQQAEEEEPPPPESLGEPSLLCSFTLVYCGLH